MIRHLPLSVPAALVAGLAVGARGLPTGAVVPAAVLCVVALAAGLRAMRARAMGAVLAFLCAAAVLGGGAWAAARVQATAPPPARGFGAASGLVAVTTIPVTTARGTRMRVEAGPMRGPGAPLPGTAVLLELPQGVAPPEVGEVVRVAGVTSAAADADAPDWWVAWVRRQGASARLRAAGWQPAAWSGGAMGARDALRRWAQRNVAAGLSGDPEAMVRGMALGGGNGLSEGAASSMRDAGLWHLLAVSGQNVAVIGIGVVAVLGALGAGRTRRVAVAGAAMLVYCLACDGGASVVRAGIMGLIGVAADLRGGRRAPWNSLLVALAVMLAVDPLSIDDPGLQLSFAAVAGLFAIAPPVGEWLRGLMPGRVADLVGQSAGAGLATAPVLAMGFGSISVVGLLANLIAVPVAGPVVVIAMLGVAGNALWHPVGVVLAWGAAVGAGVILAVARIASQVPGAVQHIPPWGVVPLVALAAAPPVAWWWLRRVPTGRATGSPPRRGAGGSHGGHETRGAGPAPRSRRASTRAVTVLVVAVLATAAMLWLLPGDGVPALPPGPGIRMLDVGQGAAVALRSGPAVDVLVDAGPPGDPAPVVAGLARMGSPGIGVLVISHGAQDHAGGALDLLSGRTAVGRVVLPAADANARLVRRIAARARKLGIPVEWAAGGMVIGAGSWDVSVVAPGREVSGAADPNTRCLVLAARAPGLSAVIPGDAESPEMAGVPLGPVDVLQVSHHGSEDPGLPALLTRLRPAVALVSAGEGNPYGHPRPPTLQALAQAGARVARTDRDGDVDARAGEGGIIVARG